MNDIGYLKKELKKQIKKEFKELKEFKEYKKKKLKKLIIPINNAMFLDSRDERISNGIYSLKNEELNIDVKNEYFDSPKIKHFEKTYYIN